MSFKMEVATMYRGEESWTSNACRYATEKEADAAGDELLSRWTVPHAHRVVPSEDPVNYRFDFDQYRPVPITETAARRIVGQLLDEHYSVVVGNIGTVYSGSSRADALAAYNEYVEQSTTDYGRAAGEGVTLLDGDQIVKEFDGDPAINAA